MQMKRNVLLGGLGVSYRELEGVHGFAWASIIKGHAQQHSLIGLMCTPCTGTQTGNTHRLDMIPDAYSSTAATVPTVGALQRVEYWFLFCWGGG